MKCDKCGETIINIPEQDSLVFINPHTDEYYCESCFDEYVQNLMMDGIERIAEELHWDYDTTDNFNE